MRIFRRKNSKLFKTRKVITNCSEIRARGSKDMFFFQIGYNFFRVLNNFEFFLRQVRMKLREEQNETFKTKID